MSVGDLYVLFFEMCCAMSKYPFCAKTRTTFEAAGRPEIIAQFDFCTHIEVVATEMPPYVVPQLRFGGEYGLLHITRTVLPIVYRMVFPPKVSKSVEGESLDAEDVLARPHGCQLHRYLTVVSADGLVERLEIERVAVGLVVYEIVYTEKPCAIDGITAGDTAVVFHLQTPCLHLAVLPEIETPRYLKITAAWCQIRPFDVLVIVEIVVDKEVGVTPFVSLEHLKGEGDKLSVAAEVIEQLGIGLGLYRQGCCQQRQCQQHRCGQVTCFHAWV